MSSITLTLDGCWAKWVSEMADRFKVSPSTIVTRLLAGAAARLSAIQNVYPTQPKKAIFQELITKDGRLWPEDPVQVFAVIRQLTMEQIEETALDDRTVVSLPMEGDA